MQAFSQQGHVARHDFFNGVRNGNVSSLHHNITKHIMATDTVVTLIPIIITINLAHLQ